MHKEESDTWWQLDEAMGRFGNIVIPFVAFTNGVSIHSEFAVSLRGSSPGFRGIVI